MAKRKKSKKVSPGKESSDAVVGVVHSDATAILQEASPRAPVKLDLGAGQNPAPGFKGVDIMPGSDHVVDLFKFPWPFQDSSVDEINSSHFLEHIPAREIEERDLVPGADKSLVGKDMLFAFMDECYRILKPAGKIHIVVPCLRNSRAFQDPTHRRFITEATFVYFNKDWRKANKLDHYRVDCDFVGTVLPTIPIEVGAYNPERQALMVNNYWNIVIDLDAQMVSNKK